MCIRAVEVEEAAVRPRFGVVLGATILMLTTFAGGAAAAPAPSTPAPTPGPTCPPALPLTGSVTGATADSLTVTYSIFFAPPCGYNPPVTVTLFASSQDARDWVNPVAEAVSGPERSGQVTIGGLSAGTEYWFRFSADGKHDPYAVGSGRTVAAQACAASVAVDSAWSGGFVATVTVRNTGTDALASWYVSWRWTGDERIVSLWNGVARPGGDGVAIGNASWNGSVPPAGSTSFGLVVSSSGAPGAIAPACVR
jgi:cellulase/cellobiase CelA1